MIDSDPAAGLPWYRYFWPWFIIALLFGSVAAGVATVFIAIANRDSLVSESWYESGTQINRRLESEANAVRRSIRAELSIDDLTGEVRIDLAGEGISNLRELVLDLSHPTQASSDLSVALVRADSGPFRGQLSDRLRGRWYASLAPSKEVAEGDASVSETPPVTADRWLLSTTLYLPSAKPLIMDGSG